MAEVDGAGKLDAAFGRLPSDPRYAEASVIVGYTAAYALPVHEAVGMVLRGLSRDPRVRRIEEGGDPAKARPRPRQREPKGRYWDPQGRGQAKFLEQPARENRARYAAIVAGEMRKGRTLVEALLVAGLALQRDSQLLVPVDTGNLKNSAFTRPEGGTG